MRKSYERFLEFALQLANVAEQSILPLYRWCEVSFKPDGSEVTEADREAERAMRDLIHRQLPDHQVLGEEFGETGGSSSYRWLIDPIDGTASFTIGVPLFGTLVALLEENAPVVGVIHLPAIEESVYAAKGSGCWFRTGREDPIELRVDPVSELRMAVCSSTGVHSSDIDAKEGQTPYRLSKVVRACRKFRFVGDCVQHALVCRGRLHAAIDTIMHPWDIGAIVPCVEEAGGKVTTLAGDTDNLVFGNSLLTSCGGPLHREILDLIRPDTSPSPHPS